MGKFLYVRSSFKPKGREAGDLIFKKLNKSSEEREREQSGII